jgi:hypothetical protein
MLAIMLPTSALKMALAEGAQNIDEQLLIISSPNCQNQKVIENIKYQFSIKVGNQSFFKNCPNFQIGEDII